jgi:hypothetical protein
MLLADEFVRAEIRYRGERLGALALRKEKER